MKYDKDLSQLTIRNMETVENTLKVVGDIEKVIFRELNRSTKEYLKSESFAITDCSIFDLYGDVDNLEFKIPRWMTDSNECLASYCIRYDDNDENESLTCLSHALGTKTATLRLSFKPVSEAFGLKKVQRKRVICEFFGSNTLLPILGFKISPSQMDIVYDFHFDGELIATEYPDFEDSFKPLRDALDALFQAHPHFCKFINELNVKDR